MYYSLRQFIRGSARRTLRTPSSNTIVVGCRRCRSDVPMHVMEISRSEPGDVLCRNCGYPVASTQRLSRYPLPAHRPPSRNLRTFALRRATSGPVSSGRSASFVSHMTTSTASDGSKKTTPTPSMKGKQRAPRTSMTAPGGSSISHVSGSSGYRNYAEEGSMYGSPPSRRSSMSLSPKPSNPVRPANFNGCEGLGDKSPPPRLSSGSLRYSVVENAGQSSSSSLGAVLPNSSAWSISLTDDGLRTTNLPFNWGHGRPLLTGVPGSPQRSTESMSQDPGSSLNHLELRQALLDRRASYPQRGRALPANDLHRRAVSRRQSHRLEYQDEREAAAESSRRRSIIGSDFGVQPSDKDVRLANLIYTSREEREGVDVNWARDVLWRQQAWQRNTRFENPLRRSSGAFEPSSAIATALASTQRFSTQDIPPPLEEEPSESDSFRRRPSSFPEAGTEQAHAERSSAHSGGTTTSRRENPRTAPQETTCRSLRSRIIQKIRRRCGKVLKTLKSKFRRQCPGSLSTIIPAIPGPPAMQITASANRSQEPTRAANPPEGSSDVSMQVDAYQNDGGNNSESDNNPDSGHYYRNHDPGQGSDVNAQYVFHQGELANASSEEVEQAELEVRRAVALVPRPLVQFEFQATPSEIGFYPAY